MCLRRHGYKISPGTSLLVDYKDAHFGGLLASQDPDWLDQAPAFDLQDAHRGQTPDKGLTRGH